MSSPHAGMAMFGAALAVASFLLTAGEMFPAIIGFGVGFLLSYHLAPEKNRSHMAHLLIHFVVAGGFAYLVVVLQQNDWLRQLGL